MARLLTGRPGVGKTIALRAAGQRLGGFRLAGFYTEEIRSAAFVDIVEYGRYDLIAGSS